MKYSAFFGISILLSILMGACQAPIQPDDSFQFEERLSQYGFFEGDLSELQPAANVLPYELNSILFTDYALKKRFVYLPEGKSLRFTAGDSLPEFPVGAILIKNFYYNLDDRDPAQGQQMVETRLLVKETDRWAVGVYVWNEDQTEAIYELLGAQREISWIDPQGSPRQVHYTVPDVNDCKSCHKRDGAVSPIGPKIRNLNRELAGQQNQLVAWAESNLLTGLPQAVAAVEKLPDWSDERYTLNERARAYLEINCAHCHAANGPASNTALSLTYEESDPHRLGICKGPVSAAQGSGDLRYDIVGGNPEASILYYRMNSAETGIAMPELGKSVVHAEGVALIKNWISQMEASPCQ